MATFTSVDTIRVNSNPNPNIYMQKCCDNADDDDVSSSPSNVLPSIAG